MQHPDVLVWHDVYRVCVNVSDLNEVGLKRQDPRIGQSETLGLSFPVDSPVGSRSPTVAIHEERELRVIEKELAVETFDVNRSNVLLASHEVQRSIGLIKQRLRFESFKRHNFKSASASNAKLRFEEVYRGGLGWNVELLVSLELILPAIEHLARESLLLLALGHSIIGFVDFDCGR